MFSPQCHCCSKSLTTSLRSGTTITRLLLLCGICSALTIPSNVILGAVPYPDLHFPFVVTTQGFNFIHIVVYLSIVFHRCRKIQRRHTANNYAKHDPNECEPAYRVLFEIPHIVIAYLDAVVWTLGFVFVAVVLFDRELYFLRDPAIRRDIDEEQLTLYGYESFFLLIGVGAAWAVAVIATLERRRRMFRNSVFRY
ncbi:hypothetical protein AX16_008377 [Volvariella volvacea WC 439]|nr:hypothetical protein AX16_008377 [Volvariella volvacea WC 439]